MSALQLTVDNTTSDNPRIIIFIACPLHCQSNSDWPCQNGYDFESVRSLLDKRRLIVASLAFQHHQGEPPGFSHRADALEFISDSTNDRRTPGIAAIAVQEGTRPIGTTCNSRRKSTVLLRINRLPSTGYMQGADYALANKTKSSDKLSIMVNRAISYLQIRMNALLVNALAARNEVPC